MTTPPTSPTSPMPRIQYQWQIIELERITVRMGLNCRFSEESITELAASIAQVGLLFPPLVVPADAIESEPGRFYLVHGHRRVAALRSLKYESAPFFVADGLTVADQYLINLAENGRENLTPAELADRCSTLVERFKPEITTDILARRTGYSVGYIQNLIRLRRKLHPDLWSVMVRMGRQAPVNALLQVVAQPYEEQIARWRKPLGAAGRQNGRQYEERLPRLTLLERAALLIKSASRDKSYEFVRGAKWLSKRLASKTNQPEPELEADEEAPPARERPRRRRAR